MWQNRQTHFKNLAANADHFTTMQSKGLNLLFLPYIHLFLHFKYFFSIVDFYCFEHMMTRIWQKMKAWGTWLTCITSSIVCKAKSLFSSISWQVCLLNHWNLGNTLKFLILLNFSLESLISEWIFWSDLEVHPGSRDLL